MPNTYSDYLKSAHWQTLRRAALDYYGRACVLCGATGVHVDVHHRTYARKGKERLRDLTVLCRDCHDKHHGSADDIEFGVPSHDDLPGIRAHFERLIANEDRAA